MKHRNLLHSKKIRGIQKRLKRKERKPSPYKRLEQELANVRNALGTAAWNYTTALQALNDLLAFYDHPPPSWTHADAAKIARIRAIARGPAV